MEDAYRAAFIRLFRLGRLCSRLPYACAEPLGAALGRRFSYLHQRRDWVIGNLRRGLGLDAEAADRVFGTLCASTGVSAQMVWRLPGLAMPWLETRIHLADAASLDRLRTTGGMILSHHSFHHNLLISSFKRWGLTSSFVANPPSKFSLNDYLYRFTVFLNAATESNLNGGRMICVDGGREFYRQVHYTFQSRQVLLVFCDFNEEKPFNRRHHFLQNTLQPPSGVVRQAVKVGVPIFFAGFQWTPEVGFELSLRELEPAEISRRDKDRDSLDAATTVVMQHYLDALTAHLRLHPHAWQMWDRW